MILNHTTPNLLLISSDRIVIDGIYKSCEKSGCTIAATIKSGEKTMEAIKLFRPNLIFIDCKIEGNLSREQTIELIKSEYDIPIISLVDWCSFNQIKKMETFSFLLKPFNYHKFSSILTIHFNNFQKKGTNPSLKAS